MTEDITDAAWSVAKLLEAEGYELRVTKTGQETLSVADSWKPAAVVLDLGLPDMHGREIARQLSARPEGAGIILIASTSWGQAQDVHQSLEAGFDARLTKPVDFQQLLEVLEEQAARHIG